MSKELSAKIKEKGTSGPHCLEYKNKINLDDFKQLALLLLDLETYGGNVEKAFFEFKRLKNKEGWPFD